MRIDFDSRLRIGQWGRLELVAIPRVTPYLAVFGGAFSGGDARASVGVTYVAADWIHFAVVAGIFGAAFLDRDLLQSAWLPAWGTAFSVTASVQVGGLRVFADAGVLTPIQGDISSWDDFDFGIDDVAHVAFTIGVASPLSD